MKKDWKIDVKGIGPVFFERSSRARRLNITVRSNIDVRVAVPYGIPLDRAVRFASTQKLWVQKQMTTMQSRMRKLAKRLKNPMEIDTQVVKKILKERTAHLAAKYNYNYNSITIRNQKTKWGSCSAKNNISLNMKLIRLPDELMDYIIIHELVHTRIKNHGPEFWQELEKAVPNAHKIRNQIKEYPLRLL